MQAANRLYELIGNTPMLRLENFEKEFSLTARIYAKLEYLNPTGSGKDRIGYALIKDGEDKGKINSDTVIIEPTGGNTGISLAYICASKKLKLMLTAPANIGSDRERLLRALGAELILTPAEDGMKGAIDKANELLAEHENAYMPGQFTSNINPKTHTDTTAKEIWEALDGRIDIFISGVGTGGTITGVGSFFKDQNSEIKIVAVEPDLSAVLSGNNPGAHKIQGIGVGFIPDTLDMTVVDEVARVTNTEAFSFSRIIAKTEGLIVGISSGAALCAALKQARRKGSEDKDICVILSDTGERYISSELYN